MAWHNLRTIVEVALSAPFHMQRRGSYDATWQVLLLTLIL